MNTRKPRPPLAGLGVLTLAIAGVTSAAAPPSPPWFTWSTVVNNTDLMPTQGCATDPSKCKAFNSYNQPSVNVKGLVVFRARSKGGDEGGGAGNGGAGGGGAGEANQPIHGIYTRDMSVASSPIIRILDRKTEVPQPNNLSTKFVETPSFPRIDMGSDTIATRGNHQPVWKYGEEGHETRAGTTGIYTNPFGPLITGASKLGAVPGFGFFAVPGIDPPVMFDVFPGAPAVTGGNTIVFKGNYTEGGIAKTGVFYRVLTNDAGGSSLVQLIANSDTEIPGLPPGISKKFGSFDSTSPPSAAAGKAVFVGLDNEANPSYGGIYEAPLSQPPNQLTLLVGLGTRVPGLTGPSFSQLGEGLSYDGRFAAFWGAWGNSTKTVRLYCPTEGNKDRIAYCQSSDSGSTFDPATDNWYQEKPVPINQGIFVYDSQTGQIWIVARTNRDFDDFIYWNFSGRVPGTGEGGEDEDDGEPARWRSSAFIAVSGSSVAFKARTGNIDKATHVYVNPVDGIYLQRNGTSQLETVLDTTMEGTVLDDTAVDSNGDSLPITELGLERDGFRGNKLVINARMGVEEGEEGDSGAGIYLTEVPNN